MITLSDLHCSAVIYVELLRFETETPEFWVRELKEILLGKRGCITNSGLERFSGTEFAPDRVCFLG